MSWVSPNRTDVGIERAKHSVKSIFKDAETVKMKTYNDKNNRLRRETADGRLRLNLGTPSPWIDQEGKKQDQSDVFCCVIVRVRIRATNYNVINIIIITPIVNVDRTAY